MKSKIQYTIMFLLILSVMAFAYINGNMEYRIAELESKWAAYEVEQNKLWVPDPIWSYTWFDLGQEYRQTVNNFFYVSHIMTSYKENGFQINGTIGNLTSIPMAVVKVKCAIRKPGTNDVTFGTTDIPLILSGQKKKFSVFVPTIETKISSVGVAVEEYRQ